MYFENNIVDNPGLTGVLNEKENEFITNDTLTELITTQFNFNNLGINYLDQYKPVPMETYDWLMTYFNENYFEVSDLLIIYEDITRLKLITTFIYEFLFVDIFKLIDNIDKNGDCKQELTTLLVDTISSLKILQTEFEEFNVNNKNINYEILKYSTILSLIDTNLDLFIENYWAFIIQEYI